MQDSQGARVYQARTLLERNRGIFCKNHNLSTSSLAQIEGNHMPLSENFANKLSDIFTNSGIICTPSWLLDGKGSPPTPKTSLENPTTDLEEIDLERIALLEATNFEKLNKNAIVAAFPYNDMFNTYRLGDLIGGILQSINFKQFIGKKVIAITEDKRTHIGFLAKGSKENVFSIVPFNLHENGLVVYDVEIQSAAEIIWHRKRRY